MAKVIKGDVCSSTLQFLKIEGNITKIIVILNLLDQIFAIIKSKKQMCKIDCETMYVVLFVDFCSHCLEKWRTKIEKKILSRKDKNNFHIQDINLKNIHVVQFPLQLAFD